MKVIMPVSYVADSGGLHDHVEEIALGARRFGDEITVAGRKGPLLRRLRSQGIDTLELDFDDIDGSIAACGSSQWDLIHAHPFASRKFGVELSRRAGIPLIVTIHGHYSDGISSWANECTFIIGVTEAVSWSLKRIEGVDPARVFTIENRTKVRRSSLPPPRLDEATPHTLAIASRIDSDFTPVSDFLSEFIEACCTQQEASWRIVLAGAGTQAPRIARQAVTEWVTTDRVSVEMVGWLDRGALEDLYDEATLVVAPGRAAFDAMIRGRLTILTRQTGIFAFPPFGNAANLLSGIPQPNRIHGADVFSTMTSILRDADSYERLSTGTSRVASLYFDSDAQAKRLHALYAAANLQGRGTSRATMPRLDPA